MQVRYLLITLALLLFVAPATAQFDKTLGRLKRQADAVLSGQAPLSEEEVGNGLKEALNVGIEEAVSFLSAKDGYYTSPYKILLPEEAQTVVKRVSALPGLNNVERDLVERVNRAAELAAAEAGPIFVDAIKGMTIKDAMNLLLGDKDAATRYLESSAGPNLQTAFLPVIKSSLDEVNATEIWQKAATAYNKIPFSKKVETELDVYVTTRALEGMFVLVEKKERELREQPALRNSDLLRKVFARQDK